MGIRAAFFAHDEEKVGHFIGRWTCGLVLPLISPRFRKGMSL